MIGQIRKIASLLIGLAVLLVGHGLVGTLLGVSGARAGFSSAELGLVMSGYSFGFIAGTIVTDRLILRVGHIRYFTAMASASSAIFILHGLIVDVYVWTVLRAICGFCMVGIYIAVESWLNQQTESHSRGGIFAVYLTVSMLAMAAGQGLLTLPLDALALFALVSILYSLGVIPIAMTRQPEPVLETAPAVSLKALFNVSPVGAVGTLAAGLINSAFYGMAAVFALAIGLDEKSIAWFIGSAIFGGALSLFAVGRWSDSRDRRKVLILILLLTTASAAGMLAAASRPYVAALTGLVYGAMAFNIYSLSAAHLNDHLERSQILAATSGLQRIYGAGSVIGPIAVGTLMAGLGPNAFIAWIAGTALLACAFALYRTTRTSAISPTEHREHVVARLPPILVQAAVESAEEDKPEPLLEP